MAWVTLGLGSNVDARSNLTSGLDSLLLNFHDMSLSSVFESAAVGYEGDAYLNMAVGLETERSVADIQVLLKEIERKHGRESSQPSLGPTTLDIDLLTHGNQRGRVSGVQLPRPEITENAFVLWPLSQVASRHKHPLLKVTYAELWKQFENNQRLSPVDFEWHGRKISAATK